MSKQGTGTDGEMRAATEKAAAHHLREMANQVRPDDVRPWYQGWAVKARRLATQLEGWVGEDAETREGLDRPRCGACHGTGRGLAPPDSS